MWDPQVKLKGGIVRVTLDLGISQVVLFEHVVSGTWFSVAHGNESSSFGLNTWFRAHGLVWPVVLYVRKKCM